jgi:hypothetical protein
VAALSSELRRQLENVVIEARDVAEAAAQSALKKRAVNVADPFPHFNATEKEQRKRLRARGRQVGDIRDDKKDTQTIDQLTQELAYEFWHRMLFARFLAENNLLMHPSGVPVTLDECNDLAPSAEPPAPNGFVLAARYASAMLPQIFRTDDVLLEIEFAPEQRLALEKKLDGLPRETFLADDSLGWVYQFWQSKKKDQVNKTGDKIDGRTLPAVTQLFTEDYMVQFLLHNTIGAWWCARHNVKGPPGGAGVSAGKAPVEMEYLRRRDDGTPAAGSFDGWPKTLAEFTMLDPCCGSGHFLVSGFNLLVPLRMQDDKLSAQQACDAVLRDNLFGLELDPRCTQIAAFALALAAWKYPGEDGQALGYRPLPQLNVACSGQGATGKKEEWLVLANGDSRLRDGMDRLYDLFQQAPDLGSLIDPRREKGDLYEAGYAELQPLLAKALAKKGGDVDLAAVGVAAQGIAKAAALLAGRYSLVATNVPYLGSGDHGPILKGYIDQHFSAGKADLATGFLLRLTYLTQSLGSLAVVSPHNWWFLSSYKKFRKQMLEKLSWHLVSTLGEEAWQSFGIRGPKATLLIVTDACPHSSSSMYSLDAAAFPTVREKIVGLAMAPMAVIEQVEQLRNPDHRITTQQLERGTLLSEYAASHKGISTNDDPRFIRAFWEMNALLPGWEFHQTSVTSNRLYDGQSNAIFYENGRGQLRNLAASEERDRARDKQGVNAWGNTGVAVSCMRVMRVSIYSGKKFNANVAVLIPKNPSHLPAIWTFCASPEFNREVRKIDQKVSVTNATLVKVPFDLEYWQTVAEAQYPNGLPEPHSNDPTQWLFQGDIVTCTDSLQVAVARLLGYRWPEQPKEPDVVDALVDDDGIVCLPGVRGESSAAERLMGMLRTANRANWSDAILHTLLTNAGCKAGTTLDDWLRNQFFEQHYKRFDQRPFVWHITDGRHKDGFSALVNYHKLNYKTLENLTYSYLGDWITAQAADAKASRAGADLRLKAAQDLQEKLKAILAGEPPYDIFVRWKPLHEQPIGWNPDLNDGVRVNIRPFVEAGILRKNPNIKWTKDRGKEPERDKDDYPWFWSGGKFTGDRVNDIHLTNLEKQAARDIMAVKENKP